MNGKVVLVTGGTSGIGKTTAIEFARAGAKVVLTGRREKEGAQVVAEIKKLDGEAAFVQAIYRGVVISARCLRAGQSFKVGASPEADAPVAGNALPGPWHTLVAANDQGWSLDLTPGMTAARW